jgi:hypothetical protein
VVPETVRTTRVTTDTKDLTVSTIRIAPGYYDTAVFDESSDKRHAGKRLAGHESEGRWYGPYVIGASSERADTREGAMDQHREALHAARTEDLA